MFCVGAAGWSLQLYSLLLADCAQPCRISPLMMISSSSLHHVRMHMHTLRVCHCGHTSAIPVKPVLWSNSGITHPQFALDCRDSARGGGYVEASLLSGEESLLLTAWPKCVLALEAHPTMRPPAGSVSCVRVCAVCPNAFNVRHGCHTFP
jgi:hypothetical protein